MNIDSATKQYLKDFGHWHIKMDFLIKEIEKLKKQTGVTSQISAFLLETQYTEFHLQGLITELDLVTSTEPQLTKFVGKRRNKEVYEMSLGELKNEIEKYKANFLSKLQLELKQLNKLRVQFAHHIFSYATSIEDLSKSAAKGIEVNDKVLLSTAKTFRFLEENSWFGKHLANKKVDKG